MNLTAAIADKRNFGEKRSLSNIKYLVIHYTGNDGDTAEANARYFQSRIVEASAHFFVDDGGVVQSVPEDSVAWSVGGKKYPSCAQSGGGKWYGKCTNQNSISVELCDTKRNGKYDFSEKTLENAAELCRSLMQKYGIPIGNVIRHFDVVGKTCPAPFVEDTRAWEDFKERLVDEVVERDEIIIERKDGRTEILDVNMIRKGGHVYPYLREISVPMGFEVSNKGKIPVLIEK